MSSHHIVREDQEPALLIADAHAISFEKVQELLEWMPTIVVLGDQLETVLQWGIKIDIVFVPANEITGWTSRLADQTPVKIISFRPGEEALVCALQFLATTQAKAANCLIKTTAAITLIESFPQFDVEVFCEEVRWSWVKNGRLDKWYETNTQLFLFPDDLNLEQPEFAFGKYLVANDGIIQLRSRESFWIGEKLN